MKIINVSEAEDIVTYVNGYPMTYADYLDNTGVEFEVVE